MVKEKLPEWFEKDFFVDEPTRLTWDELEVGQEFENVPFVVTKERIRLYAEGTDDLNPYYLDEEAAKNSQFKGLIAPPTIIVPISFATTPPDNYIKTPGAINWGQRLDFGVPVRPGDTIICKFKLKDKFIRRNKKYTLGEKHITNQNSETICIWTSGLILPE